MNKMMSAADPKLKTNFRLEFRSGSCVKGFFCKTATNFAPQSVL